MLVPWEVLCEDNEESRNLLEKLIEVAAADPLIMDEVIRGILNENVCIRAQAANMVEKITRVRPLFLMPYRRVLLNNFSTIEQPEVRCQVALFYGRVFWDEWEMQQVTDLLSKWIAQEDENISINSMQSLHILGTQKKWIRPHLLELLHKAMQHKSLVVRNLAAKLLDSMQELGN